jgi:2-polyprenyl-3-methyl-5-hydroxy-6-metoxy-1,4-benzoquinol methylase
MPAEHRVAPRTDSRIRAILELTQGPRVLDVGCAGGLQIDDPQVDSPHWLHRHLRDSFDEVFGIDLSPRRVEQLRELGFPNVFVADAQDFTLGKSFDTVVAGEVIAHLPNPGAFLRSAKRHLESRGRIVLTTPYAFGLEPVLYALAKYPQTAPNPELMVWFCPTTLRQLAASEGLGVTELRMLPDDRRLRSVSPYGLALLGQRLLRPILPERVKTKTLVAVLEPTQ